MNKQWECKYKVGDRVIISQEFKSSPHGHIINIDPITAVITRVSVTATYCPAYSLKVNNAVLPVMFWESDIDCLAEIENEENYINGKNN